MEMAAWTFTFSPAPTGDMEYLLVVDGVQADLVAAGPASGDWSCTPVTDYWSYANSLLGSRIWRWNKSCMELVEHVLL